MGRMKLGEKLSSVTKNLVCPQVPSCLAPAAHTVPVNPCQKETISTVPSSLTEQSNLSLPVSWLVGKKTCKEKEKAVIHTCTMLDNSMHHNLPAHPWDFPFPLFPPFEIWFCSGRMYSTFFITSWARVSICIKALHVYQLNVSGCFSCEPSPLLLKAQENSFQKSRTTWRISKKFCCFDWIKEVDLCSFLPSW